MSGGKTFLSKMSGSETSWSKNSGAKRPGRKCQVAKRPVPKCQGAKRPGLKKVKGRTSWHCHKQVALSALTCRFSPVALWDLADFG